VVRVVFGAGDHSRLVIGGEPHGLGLVELRILKGRQPQQPVPQPGMESVLGDVDLVAHDQLQLLRELAGQWRIVSAPRGGCSPRLVVLILRWQTHADDSTPSFGCAGDGLHPASTDPAYARQKRPLIRPRTQLLVDKDAVALVTCALL
jgi:hypothetical protein